MEGNQNVLSIHCDKSGIHIAGANNIGSTSDGFVSCKRHFLRVCSVWWNTYCGRDEEDELPRNCDVGSAEEQVERFKAYCESNMQYFRDMFGTHEGAGGWDCREDCPVGKMIDKNGSLSDHCELVWAQMPYAAEEGADE